MAFDLDDAAGYGRWRDQKLSSRPIDLTQLVVEVGDIAALTASESEALRAQVRRSNMALYVETKTSADRDDKLAVAALGQHFGLRSLDRNHLADDDGITPLAVASEGARARYIPYTERPIAWHTDGYYNPAATRVRSLILHCSRPAAQGGENKLMDPDLLYIQLRERDPDLVRVLSQPGAMTIPGNEDEGMTRPAMTGPVFFTEDGRLAMRYTARTRSIEWHADAVAAAQIIREILDAGGADIFTGRLQAGWGLLCNNVLHTRERFVDDPTRPRLLYRARYHDRIQGS